LPRERRPTASRSTSAPTARPSAAWTPSCSPRASARWLPRYAAGLENIGIVVDEKKNDVAKCRNAELDITGKGSRVKVFVIPTDEELVMTEDAYALMAGEYDVHTKYRYYFQDRSYVNKARAEGLESDLEKKPYLKELIARVP
jgi:acetate kinase